jgi:hypothetical protein
MLASAPISLCSVELDYLYVATTVLGGNLALHSHLQELMHHRFMPEVKKASWTASIAVFCHGSLQQSLFEGRGFEVKASSPVSSATLSTGRPVMIAPITLLVMTNATLVDRYQAEWSMNELLVQRHSSYTWNVLRCGTSPSLSRL